MTLSSAPIVCFKETRNHGAIKQLWLRLPHCIYVYILLRMIKWYDTTVSSEPCLIGRKACHVLTLCFIVVFIVLIFVIFILCFKPVQHFVELGWF